MIGQERVLVLDIDGTLCPTRRPDQSYADLIPDAAMLKRLLEYRADGYRVVLHTARQMRTYDGNVGELNAHMLPVLTAWLDRHGVPYDEIHVGKPWPGRDGFYVDDRTVRPAEFLALTAEQISALLDRDAVADADAPPTRFAGEQDQAAEERPR
ncbi:MAG: hypothetical protein QM679_03105 [Patulibacter sp.]